MRRRRRAGLAAWLALDAATLVACHAPLRPDTVATQSVQQLTAAVAADSRRSEHENDSKVRELLAAQAMRDAAACIALAPENAGCVYYHALALGLEARAHPLRAVESLKGMILALDHADGLDAAYDEAGPSRVKALVLARAPGWPVGPGDPDGAVTAARRAVGLKPDYPPNALALAESLQKSGDAQGASKAYSAARDLCQSLPPTPERDEWLREAVKGLEQERQQ